MSKPVVLIPIYQERLPDHEVRALDLSLQRLAVRPLRFIGPQSLDMGFYAQRYPGVAMDRFDAPAFSSIAEYNRLLLDPAFYTRYEAFEHLLILQTDAVVFEDALDHWCAQPFDYIGAPWPKPYEIRINTGRFEGGEGHYVRALVGNGGLSLRRVARCRALLREFPLELEIFRQTGSSEDLFFSVMGCLSSHFVLPNEITASRFALEGWPSRYLRLNGGQLPMGAHAWALNEREFWERSFPALAGAAPATEAS